MRLSLLAASLCLLSSVAAGPALCKDDPGVYGSIITSGTAKTAAKALKMRSYGEAEGMYRTLMGTGLDDDFCFGLYESSRNLNHWDQAALALEELFGKRPALRDQLSLEYGEVLFKLNRYDEALPQLKLALSKVNQPSLVDTRLRTLYAKSDPPETAPTPGPVIAYVPPKEPVVPPRNIVDPEKVNEGTELALTLTNAFMKSETIVIAEFKGFKADGDVSFFHPPTAFYKIEKSLKGSPLNKSISLRYEFHRKLDDEKKPAGWKWSPSLMPAVGSKWIIFIPNAVAVGERYETFHGAYGRQELNEENLDNVYRIIQEHQGQAK